jgi:electron transfer flavoprotein alpha subunit
MVASLYGVDEAQEAIWIFLEQEGGALEGVCLELLSKGRQLADIAGWSLTGLLMGQGVADLAEEAFAYGADDVVLAEHPLLEVFTVDAYTHAAFQVLMQNKPSIFLLGATPNSRDLAGRLAVRLKTGLNADCTDLRLDPQTGNLVSEVTGFGGGVLALLEMPNHRPQMSTVRPGVFPLGEPNHKREGRIITLPVELTEDVIHTQIVERVVGESLDLTQTETLVIGGRGIEGNFDMLRDLADLLGGDVGSTRPPVDEGLVERERMVGQTGTVCRPKVAIVCGVSGAFHFVVGIQEADTVIAVNSDRDAPIFEFADYCIVGDVFEVVPALIAALRSVREVSHA